MQLNVNLVFNGNAEEALRHYHSALDLNAMDAPPGRGGVPGENTIVGVITDTEAQTDAVYATLLEGGAVMMPLEKTFWSPKFGMCIDKFGFRWMVNFQLH